MFTIVKFQYDEISGQTDILVSFQTKINGRIIDDGGLFPTKQAAKNWLYQCQKDWFFTRVENYISHKKAIIDNAPRGHKTHITKLDAIAKLLRYIKYIAEKGSIYEACKYFIIEQKSFLSVLPATDNPSYKSSLQEFEYLLKWSKEYIDKHNQQQQAA